MQVIKEVWLLKNSSSGEYMCAQNTTALKLYTSETAATNNANYYLTTSGNSEAYHLPVKAYIVVED